MVKQKVVYPCNGILAGIMKKLSRIHVTRETFAKRNIMLRERSYSQVTTSCVILLI